MKIEILLEFRYYRYKIIGDLSSWKNTSGPKGIQISEKRVFDLFLQQNVKQISTWIAKYSVLKNALYVCMFGGLKDLLSSLDIKDEEGVKDEGSVKQLLSFFRY